MVTLRLDSNIKQFSRTLRDIERKQLPFATSKALNDTAFDVRKQIVDRTFPRDFKQRNKRFISAALRVSKSTKKKLIASVSDRLGREYLQRHTTGGIKRPRGRNIAVPAGVRIRSQGGVTKANRPRQLLNKPKVFITKGRSGQKVIMRRRTKKRTPAEVLYVLEPTARIRKTFRFYEDAQRVVAARFGLNFAKAWRKALATARK